MADVTVLNLVITSYLVLQGGLSLVWERRRARRSGRPVRRWVVVLDLFGLALGGFCLVLAILLATGAVE